MNLTKIKQSLGTAVGRTGLKLEKNSPHILFGAGVVGVIGTAVLASRATLRLDENLTEIEDKLAQIEKAARVAPEKYSESDAKRDKVVVVSQGVMKIAQLYSPAIVCGTLTIAALAGSHKIMTKRNAAVTAAYAAVDRAFKDYRKRVIDEHGEEADRQFRHPQLEVEDIQETEDGPKVTKRTVPDPSVKPSMYAKFFGRDSNVNWTPGHLYNHHFLDAQQTFMNAKLQMRGHVFLNEVYEALGYEHTSAGAVVGWVKQNDRDGRTGDNYIDFGHNSPGRKSSEDFQLRLTDEVWLDFNVDGVIYDKI